uniref:Uncharacterized protein n=1 Tax=Anguilla anguilla TaxID=7936 RepID=A0A0E9TFR7_ANGAN
MERSHFRRLETVFFVQKQRRIFFSSLV